MNTKREISALSSTTLVVLLIPCAILLLIMGKFLTESTDNYMDAVQANGWSLPVVLVGLYLLSLWGGTAFFALFEASGLKVIGKRLFGG